MEQSIKRSQQQFTFCFLKGIGIGTLLGLCMGNLTVGIVSGICLAFIMGIIAKRRA